MKTVHATSAALALLLLATPAAAQGEACDGPENVTVTVRGDGILVEWDEWTPARAYEVHRAEGDGDFEQVGVTNGDNPEDGEVDPHTTSFLDTGVEPGKTYHYRVQALGPPPHLSDVCGTVTATAVPVFPTLLAASAAVVGSVGAYGLLRRRE